MGANGKGAPAPGRLSQVQHSTNIDIASLRRILDLRDRTGNPSRGDLETEFGISYAELLEMAGRA